MKVGASSARRCECEKRTEHAQPAGHATSLRLPRGRPSPCTVLDDAVGAGPVDHENRYLLYFLIFIFIDYFFWPQGSVIFLSEIKLEEYDLQGDSLTEEPPLIV